MNSWIKKGFLAVLLAGSVPFSYAEEATASAPATSLDQRLRSLERKQKLADETPAAKAKDAVKATAFAAEGFSLQNVDKSFVLKFRGLVQADGRFYIDDVAGTETDQFLLRRIRP